MYPTTPKACCRTTRGWRSTVWGTQCTMTCVCVQCTGVVSVGSRQPWCCLQDCSVDTLPYVTSLEQSCDIFTRLSMDLLWPACQQALYQIQVTPASQCVCMLHNCVIYCIVYRNNKAFIDIRLRPSIATPLVAVG